jgi:hypothetical protein
MGETGGSVTSLIGRGCVPISLDIRLLLFAGIGGPSSADAAPGTGASSSAGLVTWPSSL